VYFKHLHTQQSFLSESLGNFGTVTFRHKRECFGTFPNTVQGQRVRDYRLVEGQTTNIAVIPAGIKTTDYQHISQHKFKHQHRQLPSASNSTVAIVAISADTGAIKT
jgi:hypothetical protein